MTFAPKEDVVNAPPESKCDAGAASSTGWSGAIWLSAVLLVATIAFPLAFEGSPRTSFDGRGLSTQIGLLLASAIAYFVGFWRGVVSKDRSKMMMLLSLLPVLGLLALILIPRGKPRSSE